VSSTRLTITFQGKLSAQPQPVGPASGITFAAEEAVAAAAWHLTGQDTIQTGSFTAIPWAEFNLATVLGLQVKSGPPMYARLSFTSSDQAVVPVASSLLLTFPEGDRLTLLEITGGSEGEATTFEWLVAGVKASP
jgi:hypothetical protein